MGGMSYAGINRAPQRANARVVSDQMGFAGDRSQEGSKRDPASCDWTVIQAVAFDVAEECPGGAIPGGRHGVSTFVLPNTSSCSHEKDRAATRLVHFVCDFALVMICRGCSLSGATCCTSRSPPVESARAYATALGSGEQRAMTREAESQVLDDLTE